MVFTQREKIIIAATVAAVCLLVLDFYVLSPALRARAAVQAQKEQSVAELAEARNLIQRRRVLGPKWQKMLDDGMRRDPAEAESQIYRSLRDWSDQPGMTLPSLRPERSTEKTELPEIAVHVTGTGSMRALSEFLWRVETAESPVKIKMLQIGSRKDGTDDLSFQLKVSTLYVPPNEPRADRPAPGRGSEGGDR